MSAASTSAVTQADARWGLVVAGWSVYAVYYLGRVNFSVAVPNMEAELGFDPGQVGILAAGFFWVYSLAGVPVGRLADRLGARWLVGLGLVGSGLMNVLFIMSGSFAVALLVWSANGLFQAMGWAPLLGGLGRWVPKARLKQVVASFGSCFVAGTALTFGLGGFLVESGGVESVFIVAAVVLIPLGVAWWLGVHDRVDAPSTRVTRDEAPLRRAIWLLPPAAAIGVAYVALLVWTPAYFVEVHGLSVARAGLLSSALLTIGVVVTLAQGKWFKSLEGRRTALVGAGLLLVTALSLALVPLASGLSAAVLIVALASGLVGAASSFVLGLFPYMLQAGGVAFVGGVFALAFNLGGGAGSPVVGRLVGDGSWDVVFFFLAVCVLAGAAWLGGWYARATVRGAV